MPLTDIEYIFSFLVILSIQQNSVEAVHFPSAALRRSGGQPRFGRTAVDVAIFARSQAGLPRQVSSFENGVPSHDTFSRLFSRPAR